MKKPVKIFVFLLFGKYKYFATVDLFVFHYKMVTYDMDVSEMSPKGNTVWTANAVRPGSYLYLQQDLSLET